MGFPPAAIAEIVIPDEPVDEATGVDQVLGRQAIGYATKANRVLSGDQLFTLSVPCPPNSG
jgi:hypothetical protein